MGIVTNESSTIKYIAEYPNDVKKEIPLVNRYIYQHGEHYMKMISDGKGGYSGNIKRLRNGVHTSVVLELPGQNKTAVIKGRLPPSDELLIL